MNIETEQDLEAFVQPPEPEPEISIPAPLKFRPWHKPRKQFVREMQWMRHIGGMLLKLRANSHFDNDQPFKYLTLPGSDLLDIRLVADICQSQEVKLQYLGFCHANEEEGQRLRKNVSEFEVSRSGYVVIGSRVVNAPLQDIQKPKSEASVALSKGGTYDAINIDACSPFAARDRNTTGRLIDSIRSLTEYQINKRRTSWVMFLTMPVQVDSISAESLSAIHIAVTRNVCESEQFARVMREQFDHDEDLQSYMDRISLSNGKEFLSLVSLGLTKWLIHLSTQAHYRVKIMKSFCYSIFQREPFEPNMVSLCFLFEPTSVVINDAIGLTENPVQNPVTTIGVADHIRALNKTNELENVDNILAEDDTLLQEMIEKTKGLLRQAEYPVDDHVIGYDAWLAGFP